MKTCPTCNRTYADESLTFCLADGALLSPPYDPNATLLIPSGEADPLSIKDFSSSQIPRKSRLALYVGGAAVLGLFAIIGILTLLFGLNYRSRENTNSLNMNSAASTKVSEIKFASQVLTQIDCNVLRKGTDYQIQPMEMTSYSDGKVLLRVSLCNIGSEYRILVDPHFWYTPPNNQNTVYWNSAPGMASPYSELKLESGACEVKDIWSYKTAAPVQLRRPFGKLNISACGAKTSLGSIDLNKADSQGYVQSN